MTNVDRVYRALRIGDIIELMKGTIVCIIKSNVTELCVDTRLIYRKPQLQSRERFDKSTLAGYGLTSSIRVRPVFAYLTSTHTTRSGLSA